MSKTGQRPVIMMTSSNGNIFRVTGHLCGEFTGPRRWIPRTKASDAELWALMFSLICARINAWVNNHEAGDLRRNRAHYDVSVMLRLKCTIVGDNETLNGENSCHMLLRSCSGHQQLILRDHRRWVSSTRPSTIGSNQARRFETSAYLISKFP